jgi:hypothetical protein
LDILLASASEEYSFVIWDAKGSVTRLYFCFRFGNLITIGPFPPYLCNIYGGNYQSIELSFYDTFGAPINVRDSDATITLVLSLENDVPPHQQRFM